MLHADFVTQYAAQALPDWRHLSVHRHLESHLRHLVEESSLPHLLRYEDRNSMAFGIEARVPYLDHRLAQFIFREAPGWRLHQGWTKWVMRKAMEGTVPDTIVWRRDKVGFETPEATWVRQWCQAAPHLFGEKAHSGAISEPGSGAQEASVVDGRRWCRPVAVALDQPGDMAACLAPDLTSNGV